MADETKRIVIIDASSPDNMVSVVQSTDDPSINGIVLLKPDGSSLS